MPPGCLRNWAPSARRRRKTSSRVERCRGRRFARPIPRSTHARGWETRFCHSPAALARSASRSPRASRPPTRPRPRPRGRRGTTRARGAERGRGHRAEGARRPDDVPALRADVARFRDRQDVQPAREHDPAPGRRHPRAAATCRRQLGRRLGQWLRQRGHGRRLGRRRRRRGRPLVAGRDAGALASRARRRAQRQRVRAPAGGA